MEVQLGLNIYVCTYAFYISIEFMYECMNVCMYVYFNKWKYVCMYVCVYVCTCDDGGDLSEVYLAAGSVDGEHVALAKHRDHPIGPQAHQLHH